MIHWVLCRMRLRPASACRMPAGTARAKPRSPPSRNFSGLVIVRGRAAQSVASVMKKAMPWVMSSNAVTISPDATFKNTGCPWSLSRWCDHRPGDHELDRQRRTGPVLHEQGSAGDERGHEVPGAGNEDEDQAVGDEVEPPPEPVLVQQ